MSIPKADPGLAAFVKTLDPSMYTISGGASQPNAIANEVKALKEQQEYQWYQDSARETISPESDVTRKLYASPCDPGISAITSDLSRIYLNTQSSKRNNKDEDSNPVVTLFVGIIIGIMIVLVGGLIF